MKDNVIELTPKAHAPAEEITAFPVPLADVPKVLPAVWPFVRRGLLHIKAKQGARSTWTPEHVLAAITQGGAELWLAMSATHKPLGFVVTQPLPDPFLHITQGLLVWMGYSDPRAPHVAVEKMDDTLAQVARARGYSYVEALTTRPGLPRRMARDGWETVLYVIRKPLYEGE